MAQIPPLAYHDPGFIDSDEGRPIRIVSEYLAPLRAFSAAGARGSTDDPTHAGNAASPWQLCRLQFLVRAA